MSLVSALFAYGCLARLRVLVSCSMTHRSPYFRGELLHTRWCCILPSASFSTFRACRHGGRRVTMRPAAGGPRSGRIVFCLRLSARSNLYDISQFCCHFDILNINAENDNTNTACSSKHLGYISSKILTMGVCGGEPVASKVAFSQYSSRSVKLHRELPWSEAHPMLQNISIGPSMTYM